MKIKISLTASSSGSFSIVEILKKSIDYLKLKISRVREATVIIESSKRTSGNRLPTTDNKIKMKETLD